MHVNVQVTRKLSTLTPSPQLVDAYLPGEIAKGYNISWSPPSAAQDDTAGDSAKVSVGPYRMCVHHADGPLTPD